MKLTRAACLLLAALAAPAGAAAQQDTTHDASKSDATATPAHTVTQHTATIGGQRIDYDATVGSIILRDDDGRPTAAVYYTAYTRRGPRDMDRRPITFAYNGGPGSSSIWVHMGAFGPRRVVTPDAEHASPPPYEIVDNQYSPLDETDLVFIDPVGTGFSKPLGEGKGKDFWGVDEDARSLGQFISRYLSENGRWNSPRYLMGESYGTTRSAALANYLQRSENIDLNGVILISSVLDFQTIAFSPGNDVPYVLYLPSFAAVAYYHHALPEQPQALDPFLRQAEQFALGDYAHALLAGGTLESAERDRILEQLHRYTGLSMDYLDKADLRVNNSQFEKELMREHGIVIGRLDARFAGPTDDMLGEYADYDPQSAAVSSAFTSAWNSYLHNELNFGRDMRYTVSGNVNPWNWTHGGRRGWPGFTNVAVDLAQAMKHDPKLQVLVNNGVYDLATPYFATVYTMDHLGLPPELRSHIQRVDYEAGHMMYLHVPSLAKLKQNIAAFIERTSSPNAPTRAVAEEGAH